MVIMMDMASGEKEALTEAPERDEFGAYAEEVMYAECLPPQPLGLELVERKEEAQPADVEGFLARLYRLAL
ncbi:MAG: hypothetical protein N2441_06610 [Rhodocyclaceae bacterium]|nr:hypothetical protein [Rhodocyclaceae bacterium]